MKIDQKENLCNTMITSFMASAKQIAWRKKFARMSKAGAFKKKQSQSKSAKNPKTIGAKSNPHNKKSTGSNRVFKRLEKLKNGGK